MNRRIEFAPVTHPAPPALDAVALDRALATIRYQFNLLAGDVERHREEHIGLADSVRRMREEIVQHNEALSDLHQLIEFLEKNPGADLKDWARYEAVKRRMKEAADVRKV